MAWTTPKTAWTENDFFNVADWDRIRLNLEFLRAYAGNFFPLVSISATSEKTVQSWLYASDLNALEENLTAINDGSVQLDVGAQKVFQPNGPSIDYAELNRIESACAMIYEGIRKYLNRVYFADDELYADESVGVI